MAGPWDDYKETAGPWVDYAAPQASATAAPWEDFAPKEKSPGIFDYGTEVAKSFLKGGVSAAVTSPMKGIAGQIYEPDTSTPLPTPPPGGYKTEAEVPELPILPVQRSTLYRGAEAVEGMLPKDRDILNPVVRDVASGFGSVAGNLATLLVPGLRVASPVLMPAQGAGESVERAVQAQATQDQIRRAANFGNIAGATEFLDVLLVNSGTYGKAAGLIKQVGMRAVRGAFIEGGQEGLQQFIQNSIARGVYKPEQALEEGVAYNALIGAIVGGGVGSLGIGERAPQTPPTQEDFVAGVAPVGQPPVAPTPVVPVTPTVAPTTPQAPPDPTVIQSEIDRLQRNRDYYGARPGNEDYLAPLDRDIAALKAMLPAESPADVAAKTLPAEQVTFMQQEEKKFEPLRVPENAQDIPFDNLLAQAKVGTPVMQDTVRTNPGVDEVRLAELLSQNLYGNMDSLVPVSVKEMFQNSFDAIKGFLEQSTTKNDVGNIDINMDPKKRVIRVYDDGLGMPASVMGNEFLKIGGTKKESKRASGGHGIAKMQFLFGSKNLRVRSLRGGQYAELSTSGEELRTALADKTKSPNMSVRSATSDDLKLFPKGHGTIVEITVPEQYIDPATGEARKIGFDTWQGAYPVLRNSPLFDNINVNFNGAPLAMGTQFPLEQYTQFANVNFNWGTARVYVTREPNQTYGKNLHVLSNGLWQFSINLKRNPNTYENIPLNFYIDVNPRVTSTEQGYPFSLDRQQFSKAVEKDFGQIFNYMQLLYQRVGLEEMATNFGTMQYLDYKDNKVVGDKPITIEPKSPPPPNAITLIKPGDTVRVEDGKLIVNGREVPELTPQMLDEFKVTTDDLSIDQSTIMSDRVILHDNTNIIVSPSETRSIVDYGREKFGRRFDEFTFAVGEMFKQLRNAVAKGMPKPPSADLDMSSIPSLFNTAMAKVTGQTSGYEDLTEGAVGISLDREYHGVSIMLPFRGIFVNPFLITTTAKDPGNAALSTITTMIHEIAHHKPEHRTGEGHGVGWRHEMGNIQIMLDLSNDININEFKQRMINAFTKYQDVFDHINAVYTSGDFRLQPRGKRFQDFGDEQRTNDNVSGNAPAVGSLPPRGSTMAEWSLASEAVPPPKSGPPNHANTVAGSGARGSSDNGRGANYNATKSIDPGITAPPQQPEVSVVARGVDNVLGGPTPEMKEARAHADRWNWMYKYMAGVTQLLDGNPYFQPLRKYVERIRLMHGDETKVHDAAIKLLRRWRWLGSQSKNLEALIEDVQLMSFLSEQERKNQAWRHPTAAEFGQLATKHQVSKEALEVYNDIRKMDDVFMLFLEGQAKQAAIRKITDPIKLADRIDEIEAIGRQARAQPFFPFTRFGRYYVTIKDKAGTVVHFETFEPERVLGVQVRGAERFQKAKENQLRAKWGPQGYTVESGVLPETAGPLIGLPTLLQQQLMGEDIGLTDDQIAAMRLLQNARNPAMALGKRSIPQNRSIQGHSLDLPRAFARYYFFAGRYAAKTAHSWALRGHIAEAQLSPGNKAGLIASYMGDHLRNTVLDARGDFGFFKAAVFLWAMGYVPAAATQNLTQTPMITYPFLGAKFGDIQATKHIVKAMADITNFYKKGTYDSPNLSFEMSALGYGIQTGRISETQAPELAGLAGGGNLIAGLGGRPVERAAVRFQEGAAWMFETAEQFNRRVAFRAALRLAQEQPTAKFVTESVNKYQAEFQALQLGGLTASQRDMGMTPTQRIYTEAEARSIVTAIHAVDQTQYVYARYARSRLFRGPRNIFFVFKQYLQSTLWMLGNNKRDVLPRYLIIAMLMGGLGGIPGYEDMKHIFRAIAKWFFGKNADPDKLIREYTLQWFDGTVAPDLVLHGLARKGFGIPAIMDLMGSNPSRGLIAPGFTPGQNIPFPTIDRSRAITMGTILPFEVGKLFEPQDKTDRTIVDQTQKASGAVFSVGFNLYKALMDNDPAFVGDTWQVNTKRFEKAVPRALGSVSRAYRAFDEGRERGRGGPNSAPTIVPYDVRDTEQMMEIIAMAAGYQPLRQQAKWDLIMARAEATAFYDFNRKRLMEQYHEALHGKNKDEIGKVRDEIIQYNRNLPDFAKSRSITGDTIQKSMIGRERTLISRESGIPIQKSNVGISREMERLFPEATVDVRRVR